MLKKAGIVVAAAAAGLLAVSPLAFAGDKGYDHEDGGSYSYEETNIHDNLNDNFSDNDGNFSDNNVANVSENNVNVPICNNDVPVALAQVPNPAEDLAAAATGALSLFGGESDADTDVDSTTGDSCEIMNH